MTKILKKATPHENRLKDYFTNEFWGQFWGHDT